MFRLSPKFSRNFNITNFNITNFNITNFNIVMKNCMLIKKNLNTKKQGEI